MRFKKDGDDKGSAISIKTCIYIGVTVFILYLCMCYWPAVAWFLSALIGASLPLIIGGVIAYPLNILMSFYERHYFKKSKKPFVLKTKRPLCIVFSIISLLAIMAAVVGLVLPQFIECVKLMIDQLPAAADKVVAFLEKHHAITGDTIEYINSIDWKERVGELLGTVSTGIGSVMETLATTVYSVFSGVVTAVLSVIFAVYILLSKEKLGFQLNRVIKNYTKLSWYDKYKYFITELNDCFKKYIIGQCVEAVILGVLCCVGMLILRLPYAPMISALIALTALLPIVGAYLGGGVGAFLILMESPVKALIFIVFILILQQIEGNFIYPKVVGNSIGLPGIWVLAAITIGGGVFGVLGMLFGVPFAATVYRIIRKNVNKKENSKRFEEKSNDAKDF